MVGKRFIEKILFPDKEFYQEKLRQAVTGKTVLITGATYGIGEALVHQLAGLPVQLILLARTKEKLESLKSELESKGTEAICFPVDLYQQEQVRQVAGQLKAQGYEPDILIHNAGKSIARSIEQSTERIHDYTRTMAVNYESPVLLSLAFLPSLIKKKGQIIYVSAVNVLFHSVPGWSAYQASKTAMDQWGKAAATELSAKGVSVTAIYLPLVRTRMIEPTAAYRSMPAMSPTQAATIISSGMIRRFRRWSPWWSFVPSFLSYTFPVLWRKALWKSFKKEN